ncbi:MAG: DUF2066 domain-containing protein [Alphaproteobacteria bacterium]
MLISWLLMLSLLTINPARANDLYRVQNIYIEQFNNDSVIAKNQALALVKQRAFKILLARLSLAKPNQQTPNQQIIDPNQLEGMIRDIEFLSEQFGGGVYQAQLNIRFNPDPVRAYFSRNAIPFSETKGPDLLVIPLLELGNNTLIWQDDNPLNRAIDRALALDQNGMVNLIPPNIQIDHEQIIATPNLIERIRDAMNSTLPSLPPAFSRLNLLYNSDGAIVINVRLSRFGIADIADVLIIPLSNAWRQAAVRLKITATPSEPRNDFIDRIAQLSITEINRIWKTRTFVDPNSSLEAIKIHADLADFQQWLRLKRDLEQVAGLDRMAVRALKTDKVWFDIFQRGGFGQLRVALESLGYLLAPDPEIPEHYRLSHPDQ